MRYLSLFSGIGGFELGIQQAYENTKIRLIQQEISRSEHSGNIESGWRHTEPDCVGYSEIDKYAIATYQSHFPEHKNYGDITKIKAEDLPEFDLIVGGFPCQSFSIAGKRGGFNDTRGTMFFEIARILKAKQPRLLLLENVKGLLSHDEGRTFATIIATLDELGYDLQWQVLNSKNFGVPQNRERVFIVGHLRGTPRPEIFPIEETSGATHKRYKSANSSREVAQTIRQRYGNGTGSHIQQLNRPKHSNDRIYDPKGISPTLNTMQGGNRQPFVVAERGRYTAKGKIKQNPEPRYDGVSNTLTSVEKDNRVFDGMKIRRLTPVECERLQGFPDGWTQSVSDTQRYKCLGNAVTVNVIEDIISKIINS